MTNIMELRVLIAELDALLRDPHPGLFSWQGAYRRAVQKLLKFWDAVPGQIHEDCINVSPHEDNEE